MTIEGTQLARAMLSIHEADMSQAARYPGYALSDRIERRVMFRQGGSRALCRVGRLLVTVGQRLQEYGMPRQLPLNNPATQR
jgi:hypothetical protein